MFDGAELPSAMTGFGRGWAGTMAYFKYSVLATTDVQVGEETRRRTRNGVEQGERCGSRITYCWRELKRGE